MVVLCDLYDCEGNSIMNKEQIDKLVALDGDGCTMLLHGDEIYLEEVGVGEAEAMKSLALEERVAILEKTVDRVLSALCGRY